MAFSLVSSCPDCGAPIWADLEDQSKNNPPQSRFTCECRFEKNLHSLVPEPITEYPPITIRYPTPTPAPSYPFPSVWHNDQTQTPPDYVNMPWTGDPLPAFIPTVF